MRQVPHFLLIGSGRLAKHFQHYFSLLNLSFDQWSRQQSLLELTEKYKKSSHILLLIRDDAIENFISQHLKNVKDKFLIHCSGSLVTDLAYGVHPLMTFGPELYDLTEYQSIPFICDDDAPAFDLLFPGLMNANARLKKTLKAKYHAWCVISGNFSCFLWQNFFYNLEHEFNLPQDFAIPYMQRQTRNLIANPHQAMTGPLVRDDKKTIAKNISALSNDPFAEVYKSVVLAYDQKRE